MDAIADPLPAGARILDAGGWFKPWPRATHMVDLMPYETRRCKVQLGKLPEERFSKDTWHQADFLNPGLRLPYPDDFFDFAWCGQTIEDLASPEHLLRELGRVARSGCIETPSRLAEQTIGVRDRISPVQGYAHHQWIVDSDGRTLSLSRKTASLCGAPASHAVPLAVYERIARADAARALLRHFWKGGVHWRVIEDAEAAERAAAFVRELGIRRRDRLLDAATRGLRAAKWRLFRPPPQSTDDWWQRMLELSRPFSSIPL